MSYVNRNFTWDFNALKRFYEKYVIKWINSAVSWTDAQKKQARANLGFGDGDIDDKPTANSYNPVKSGGVQNELALGAVYDVSAKNPTAGSNSDGKWESLSALLSDANLSTLIPTDVRKGGMSIKFIQNSDNKYVQYRFTLSEFTDTQFTDIINWRKDNVPVPDVAVVTGKILKVDGSEGSTAVSSFAITDYIFAVPGTTIYVHKPSLSFNYTLICFYDSNKIFVSAITSDSTTPNHFNVTLTEDMIPDGAIFFRANINPVNFILTTSYESNYAKLLAEYSEKYRIDASINKIDHALLVNDGTIATNPAWSDKYVTDYFPIGEQVSIVNLLIGASGDVANVALCFYDESFNFISYLQKDATVKQLTLTANDIPSGAVYGRSPVTADGQILLTKNLTEKYNNIPLELAKLNIISYNDGTVIDLDGNISSTTVSNFKSCNYCFAKEGIELVSLHRVSSYDNIVVYFYDENFNPISYLSASEAFSNLVLNSSNIPASAKYFRANFRDSGYVKNYKSKIINESDILDLKKDYYYKNALFDYGAVLAMDKGELRSMVETASNGRCTVLYDDEGYPSLMHKIPKISIGALAPALGGLSDVHPAFIVNGVEKNIIYMAVFETCLYQGHYVSWYGLSSEGRITVPNLRQNISNKGNGWHLETIYERSLLVLLTMNLNSPTPTGNTNKGMSHLKNWEYCQIYKNTLPGRINHEDVNGLKWINGTQPSSWSHNKELWGIQDVIGGFHEICDLMKLVNGKIYIAADNNFFKKGDDISTFENSWIDSGVAFDYINDNIVLNTSVTHPMDVQFYILKTYPQIGCTAQYDALSESIRKKMCLLLMASRLTSSDVNPIFEINGRFGIANHKQLCYGVFGGAEEYEESGLGSQITAYPIDDNDTEGHNAHLNMGSRMVYIP